jgi:hypothetical protein
MAGKNNDSRILRATHIIVGASSADSHFLPFTHDPRHDSGGSARQDNYFFVASLLCLSVKKLRISGILFAPPVLGILSFCLSGKSFFRLENTLEPVSSLAARNVRKRIKSPTLEDNKERNWHL